MQTLELKPPYLKKNKLVIVCSKGSLDMAYPPLMLATTGAAMGMEAEGKNPQKLVREERSLVNRNVTYIEEKVDRVDLHRQEISMETGRKLPYDYLIIATGSVPNPDTIPGPSRGTLNFHTGPEQSLKIWKAIQQLEKGHVVVGSP
jgi:NADH dehydrogenase FAD-containing subunit